MENSFMEQCKTLTGMSLAVATDELKKVLPASAYKAVPGATNLTDTNPAWLTEVVTRIFGPCGIGWWYYINQGAVSVERQTMERRSGGTYDQWVVFIPDFSLYYSYFLPDGTQKTSAPILASGEAKNKERNFAHKGAITNCLGAAWSKMCWQIYVYKGQVSHLNAAQMFERQQALLNGTAEVVADVEPEVETGGSVVARTQAAVPRVSPRIGQQPIQVQENPISPDEYARTKTGFCNWARNAFGIQPAQVPTILTNAQMEFDLAQWERMVETIRNSVVSLP